MLAFSDPSRALSKADSSSFDSLKIGKVKMFVFLIFEIGVRRPLVETQKSTNFIKGFPSLSFVV